MIPKKIEDVLYPNPNWWNPEINKLATVENCLPNCTALVWGCAKPVSTIRDARSWHKYLINGWTSVPYSQYKSQIKVGDVIEWEAGNHVAIVSEMREEPWISGSFYTGIHGKAMYDGSYDTRDGLTSLKQVNDYFITKYSYRFFHFVPLSEESKWCGSEPDYVLVSPTSIEPVKRDSSKNQAYVGTTGLRLRTAPNLDGDIRGTVPIGYYNVEKIKGGDFGEGDTWFKVGDYYFASVQGVIYYPKEEIAPLDEMIKLMEQMQESYLKVCNERDDYKRKIELIKGIINE